MCWEFSATLSQETVASSSPASRECYSFSKLTGAPAQAANPKLPKNKVIEVIESKELDDGSGVIRMQFQKGASPKRRAPRSTPRLNAWRRAKP
jgi:hypothetical protein